MNDFKFYFKFLWNNSILVLKWRSYKVNFSISHIDVVYSIISYDQITIFASRCRVQLRLILYTGSESDKSNLDLTNHNFIYSNPSFFSILNSWLQVYKENDFEEFERNGLTEEMFQMILEKIIPLGTLEEMLRKNIVKAVRDRRSPYP